jgi:hypothetical protein
MGDNVALVAVLQEEARRRFAPPMMGPAGGAHDQALARARPTYTAAFLVGKPAPGRTHVPDSSVVSTCYRVGKIFLDTLPYR